MESHPIYKRLSKYLAKIQAGTNLYNIRSIEVNTGSSPHLFIVSGSIKVPQDAGNLQNAGKTFQIRIEYSQNYPFISPIVYCNRVRVDLIDTIGYHIDLERKGLHDWAAKPWNSPIIGTNLPEYFAGVSYEDQNGWVNWTPVIELETIFKMMQYMLERSGPPPPPPPSNCNIDFTIIPRLLPNEVADLDLSRDSCPITLSEFISGEEYYMITKVIPQKKGPPVTNITCCNIEGLQTWLSHSSREECKHPALRNIVVEQNDIRRFIYTGPAYVEGGGISKRKSRTFKKNNRKSRK